MAHTLLAWIACRASPRRSFLALAPVRRRAYSIQRAAGFDRILEAVSSAKENSMRERYGCLFGAVFLAFMIATAGVAIVPGVSRVSSFLCAGRFEVDASARKHIKEFCVDEQTGKRTLLNPFLVMATTMAVFAAGLALPALLIGSLAGRAGGRERRRQQELRDAAIPTTATVRAVREGKAAVRRAGRLTRDVELVLSLEIDDGYRGAALVEVVWLVNELHFAQVQVGQPVAVRVSPADPQRVYPAVEWATLAKG
jgi:hypothetical protein